MLTKLRKQLESKEVSAYLVTNKENVRYISGYTGDDSWLLITPENQYFITDPRYTEQASQECPDYTMINWRLPGRTKGDAISDITKEDPVPTIGFESDIVSFESYTDINDKTEANMVPMSGLIEQIREIKTPQEIEYLRISCDIACRAFERILDDIRVGITEKELAAKLSSYMVEEGADTQPYGNIIISGSRTSLLHGIPSEKAVEYGDFVLMDFGCQYKGYLSDMTRTVVVGKATAEQKRIYALEKEMLELSLDKMEAGMPVKDIYEASIAPIKDTEDFKYHYANIGHGIGLSVHEMPFMSTNYSNILAVGNVVTIEPGLYIPGWGGIRIEDQIVITEDGYENFIWITHDLIEL